MNNFEQVVNIKEKLSQVVDNLMLVIKNDGQFTPIERDVLLQMLREVYVDVLHVPIEQPQKTESSDFPKPVAAPQKMEEQPKPEPQKPVPVKVDPIVPDVTPETVISPVKPAKNEPIRPSMMASQMVETPAPKEPEVELELTLIEEPDPQPAPAPKPQPVIEPLPEPQPAPEPTPAPEVAPIPEIKPVQPAASDLMFSDKIPQKPKIEPQKKSLNDLLQQQVEDKSIGTQFQHAKVEDLSKSISLNDKFLFIKVLFNNKGEEFGTAIQKLNQCKNIEEAFEEIEMLKKYYFWDTSSSAYLSLCDLVRRKFI